MTVDLDHVLLADADGRAVPIQRIVTVRDEGTEPVVAAEPLEHHEDLARGGGQRLGRCPKEWR